MLLSWRIRYLDSQDKQFKNRDLLLDTDTLDTITKAAVETVYELQQNNYNRSMLQYRHLFHEVENYEDEIRKLYQHPVPSNSVYVFGYIEDENGQEINSREIGRILMGTENAFMFPAGTPEYRIKYDLAPKKKVPLDKIQITQDQLKVWGYFIRDYQEMVKSSFYNEGAGKLTGKESLQTSVSDEELRSFVTIFRRLYMDKEPYNFMKAVAVFGEALQNYAESDYILGIGKHYESELKQPPKFVPYIGSENTPFTRKRLLDVHIYTQYAHQPCPKRERQYRECLAAFDNSKPLLTWVFLSEMLNCAAHIQNAGNVIVFIYEHYCIAHKLSPDVLTSLAADHPELGKLETKQERQKRILNEKAYDIATSLWEKAGQPSGGPEQFIGAARQQLNKALGWENA